MGFDGKVALVTGGNSGIGKATAIKFAEQGAKVVIAARRVDQGNAVVEEIERAGGEAMFVQTDVAAAGDVRNVLTQTVARFGRLDFAFNNAGILQDHSLVHETADDIWNLGIAVNLTGTFQCMKAELAQMLKQGSGVIINDSSAGGLRGTQGRSSYIAAKHGVIGLTKAAALEYVRSGIRVNAICPGFIDTPMTASFYGDHEGRDRIASNQAPGRHGEPEEVAAVVTWLCSDAASFVNGIAMPVDGGVLAR